VCRSQLFLHALLSALWPVETSSCLAPDDVSATEHSASPLLRRGTVFRPTFVLHQHCLLSNTDCMCLLFKCYSFVFAFIFCSSVINLIRVAYVVQHPCSDFTDMLRHLTNCGIIIIMLHG